MYIKEIELNNFRIYKGVNRISLSPKDDKNIVIVSGQNGFGKTTFLMALVWCLYGKNMQKVDEIYKKEISDKGNYQRYIADCLNRNAEEEGQNSFSVQISFSNVQIQELPCDVLIKRSYNNFNYEENIEVSLSGQPQELIENLSEDPKKAAEIFIRDFIMPDAIAKFFFFDAEKITSLAEINQKEQSKELSMAYSEVLGIKKYEDLKQNLEAKLDEYRKNSAKTKDKQKLNEVEAAIKNAELEIEDTEEQIQTLTDEVNLQKREVDQIVTKLLREGSKMSQTEIDELKISKQKLEEEKANLKNSLKELYDNLPFAIAGETLLYVAEQVKNERILSEQKFKHQDVDEKILKIRQDIENHKIDIKFTVPIQVADFYNEQIEVLIRKYFAENAELQNENVEILHEFSENQEKDLNKLIATIKNEFKNKFEQINTNFNQTKIQLENVNRKLREAERESENSIILSLREEKNRLESEISQKEQKIGSLRGKIENLEKGLKTSRQEQAIIRKTIDDSTHYAAKAQKTKELIDILNHFIQKFKEQKRDSLQTKMLATINKLLHKQHFVNRVDVNILSSENIDIDLYDSNNKIINKSTLSMGERQLYASALLGALVSESEIEFPVFIDSPMQKFDKDHSDNIIKYFYPNVSKQVVIFPLLHTELRKDNYKLLQDNISKTFLINNTTPNSSEFIELEPDIFFELTNI